MSGASKLCPGIGLAMSGGGFRSTLFHLGALKRLDELGILDNVVHVSSVSGGSITAGALAKSFMEAPSMTWPARVTLVSTRLRAFCSETIDVGTIVGGVLNPFLRTSDLLAEAYEPLVGAYSLRDLVGTTPTFTFCATNLQSGRLVHLTPEHIADYRIGRLELNVTLARAVAASSAFPPFLSPVVVDCGDPAWKPLAHSTLTDDQAFTRKLYLADGGAYDNMGLEPVWNRYEQVLVSDAGAPYAPTPDISSDWLSQLQAVFEIATDQARGVRKRWLVDQFQRGVIAGAYWGINTSIAEYALEDALDIAPAMIAQLAATRTRLNGFSTEEQERLINWGYAAADASVRRNCPHLCAPDAPGAHWPCPSTNMH